jgi:putative transcriptional regulator
MRGLSGKLRGQVAASFLVVSMAVIATLATAQKAQCTDLTTPSFLVATRYLQDPLFQRSVVLMIPSTEPPLLAGLIINTPVNVPVRAMFPHARRLERTQETMYLGGPVEAGEVSVIFRASSPPGSATRVFDDTYVAAGRDAVAAVLQDPRIADLRVILGKAQWLRVQLDGEIMRGAWYVVPAKPDLVFGDPKDLWSTLVQGGDLQETQAGRASGASPAIAGEQGAARVFTIEFMPPAPKLPQWRFNATN